MSFFKNKKVLLKVFFLIFLGSNFLCSAFWYFKSEDYAIVRNLQICIMSFSEGYNFIAKKFYRAEQVKSGILYDATMQGLGRAPKDRYTGYFPAREATLFNNHVSGYFIGVGIICEQKAEGWVISYIYPGSPAANLKLLKGDFILAINDEKINEKNILLLKESNEISQLKLVISRMGQTFDVQLPIDRVSFLDVCGSGMLSEQVLYVAITQFSINVYERLLNVLQQYESQAKSLILDLRDNPGGSLKESVMMASLFFEPNLKVVDVISRNDQHHIYKSRKFPFVWKKPVIILVNDQSASASELFSGAMQDYHKALLLGQKTFGKAHVQEVHELPNGGSMKVTTAIYVTPQGKMIHAIGLPPDVEVKISNEEKKVINQIKRFPDFDVKDLLVKDRQLQEALKILTTKVAYETLIQNQKLKEQNNDN